MAGERLAYKRVSSVDQSGDRQLAGIEFDRLFEDYASGKDSRRPALQDLIIFAREGDTILVHSIDRLARNLEDLLRFVTTQNARGVHVQFVSENLTFAGEADPRTKLLLSLFGAIAEFERALIRERQREGIALARAKNAYKGRKPKLSGAQAAELRNLFKGGTGATVLARRFGIHRSRVYAYANEGTEAHR